MALRTSLRSFGSRSMTPRRVCQSFVTFQLPTLEDVVGRQRFQQHQQRRKDYSNRVIFYSTTSSTATSTTTTTNNTVNSNSHERQIVLEHHHNRNDDNSNAKISVLTLNRPKANAMGSIMLSQLKESIQRLEDEERTHGIPNCTRCLVIQSYSEKVFSAGADLKERMQMSLTEAEEFVSDLRMTMHRLSQLPIPVIAAIEGVAVGGGFEIALAADIRIASTTSTFGLPETSLAIIPGAGGTQRLCRLIGMARAKELIYTGCRIDGTTAERYGIVQHVVPPGMAYTKALEMAWQIAANGPIAIRSAKYVIDHGMQMDTMYDALTITERNSYAKVLSTQDRLEGLTAFQEGRKPNYQGK